MRENEREIELRWFRQVMCEEMIVKAVRGIMGYQCGKKEGDEEIDRWNRE